MKPKRILVVDDDARIRQLFRTTLVLDGFAVETAEDGLGALRRVDEGRFDLIVLDLHMPRLDGMSVLRDLRANRHTRGVPVIVVTGADYSVAVAQANAILRKPCEPEQLVSVIAQHLHAA